MDLFWNDPLKSGNTDKMVTISLQILGIQFFKKNSAIFSKQETMRYLTGKFGNCTGKISKI